MPMPCYCYLQKPFVPPKELPCGAIKVIYPFSKITGFHPCLRLANVALAACVCASIVWVKSKCQKRFVTMICVMKNGGKHNASHIKCRSRRLNDINEIHRNLFINARFGWRVTGSEVKLIGRVGHHHGRQHHPLCVATHIVMKWIDSPQIHHM